MDNKPTLPSIKEKKRTFWADHIRQFKISGKTQKSYCQTHKLKIHQLIYWNSVFSEVEDCQDLPIKSGFISVPLAQSPESSEKMLTIHLPNGIRAEGVDLNNLNLIEVMLRWPA